MHMINTLEPLCDFHMYQEEIEVATGHRPFYQIINIAVRYTTGGNF